MDKFEKFANTESTIRKYLTSLARLEERYRLARIDEISKGYSAKKPFLPSRSITNEMRILINKIRAIEYRHNRYASSTNRLIMVEEMINDEPVFIHSREILNKILERSAAIKSGLIIHNEEEFKGGHSPTKEKLQKKADSMALYKKLIGQAKRTSVANSTAQDNAVMSILTNEEPVCEYTTDIIENVKK